MKVKILQSISSPSFSYAAGQIVTVGKERATEFIKYDIAEPYETATKKTSTKKKGDTDADDS